MAAILEIPVARVDSVGYSEKTGQYYIRIEDMDSGSNWEFATLDKSWEQLAPVDGKANYYQLQVAVTTRVFRTPSGSSITLTAHAVKAEKLLVTLNVARAAPPK